MKTMTTVRVNYHQERDGWWAESPDIDGWSVAGRSYAEVRRLASEGVSFATGRDAVVEHEAPADERRGA